MPTEIHEGTCLFCGIKFVSRNKSPKYCCMEHRKLDKKTKQHTCVYCGKKFTRPGKKVVKFCSQECFNANRCPPTKKCVQCGKEYRQKRGSGSSDLFCSKDCYLASIWASHKKCKHCGKPIPTTQDVTFCSIACRVSHKRPKPRNCSVCGALFSPIKYYNPNGNNSGAKQNRKTCSDKCRDILKRENAIKFAQTRHNACGPDHHRWRGGTSSYWGRGKGWERTAEKVRDRDNRTCQHCGKTEEENGRRLDVHHITPFHDINNVVKANKMSNLISLCQSCHQSAEAQIRNKQILLPFAAITQAKRRDARASAQA